ncbi:hypothetical protein [Streptococcus sp. zg-JUN1979]|uniref:hypothetical protein n=1 Tax=Streptococcus sp. zg-JUN1979 TaxID=3391450 RepID=UPI0039A621DE
MNKRLEQLKKRRERFVADLKKVKKQQEELEAKEKDLISSFNEADADYKMALIADSGLTIEDLEAKVKDKRQSDKDKSQSSYSYHQDEAGLENGGEGHVSNH